MGDDIFELESERFKKINNTVEIIENKYGIYKISGLLFKSSPDHISTS